MSAIPYAAAATLALLGAGSAFLFRKRNDVVDSEDKAYTLAELKEFALNVIEDAIKGDADYRDLVEKVKQEQNKQTMREALKVCMLGSREDKIFVKAYIRDAMEVVYDFNHANCDKIIPFNRADRLTSQEKFDIVLFKFSQEFGSTAFTEILNKYNLFRLRPLDYEDSSPVMSTEVEYDTAGNPIEIEGLEPGPSEGYYFSDKDIDYIFEMENFVLTEEDKRDLIVQRVYQEIKGLGVIDELRDQTIDGISGGESGLPAELAYAIDLESYDLNFSNRVARSYDSVWCFYRGESMHLQCLSFGTQDELVRICQVVYSHNSPGQFDRQTGHKINDMADQSRVVVVGPNLTDRWTFFMRKFDNKIVKYNKLWNHENTSFAITTLDLLMKGAVTSGWTGQQGTGKTTAMKTSIGSIYHHLTLRVQEGSFFEIWIPKTYGNRSAIAFKETDKVSVTDGMIIQRKTNGMVNLLSEIADDSWFPIVMKMGQAGSLFTLFTHHATTAEGLMDAVANALVSAGLFETRNEAITYVLGIMRVNVHFDKDAGNRFIGRITEYVPIADEIKYDEAFLKYLEEGDYNASVAWYNKVKYQKILKQEAVVYQAVDILRYENGVYVPGEAPSRSLIAHMKKNTRPRDAKRIDDWLMKYWGVDYNAN